MTKIQNSKLTRRMRVILMGQTRELRPSENCHSQLDWESRRSNKWFKYWVPSGVYPRPRSGAGMTKTMVLRTFRTVWLPSPKPEGTSWVPSLRSGRPDGQFLTSSPTGSRIGLRISPRRGFSIVELLVVLAIIGLIGTLIFTQIESTRTKTRDTEREQEIKALKDALALHIVNAKLYPVYTGPLTGQDPASTALVTSDAIQVIPLDPFNTGNYRYTYTSTDGATYMLTYYLETSTIPGKAMGEQRAGP